LSGRGLCDELITRPEESYRLWCVVVCDLETSWMRGPWPTGGCRAKTNKQTNLPLVSWIMPGYYANVIVFKYIHLIEGPLEAYLRYGKFHPTPCHEGTEGEQKYNSTLSLISSLDGCDCLTPRPSRFTPGIDQAPLHKRGLAIMRPWREVFAALCYLKSFSKTI